MTSRGEWLTVVNKNKANNGGGQERAGNGDTGGNFGQIASVITGAIMVVPMRPHPTRQTKMMAYIFKMIRPATSKYAS
jgi:hypothetical protein